MIGIIAALQFEIEGVLKKIDVVETREICELSFYRGKYAEKDIVLAACGEGKVNAARCAQTMVLGFGVSSIINIGVAGGLKEGLQVDEVVVAAAVVQHDFDMTGIEVPLGAVPRGKRSAQFPFGDKLAAMIPCSEQLVSIIKNALEDMGVRYTSGVIATGDSFISTEQKRRHIINSFDAIACDMEGAAVAYVCSTANIPFAELRKISDGADDNADKSYFKYHTVYSMEEMLQRIIEDL